MTFANKVRSFANKVGEYRWAINRILLVFLICLFVAALVLAWHLYILPGMAGIITNGA